MQQYNFFFFCIVWTTFSKSINLKYLLASLDGLEIVWHFIYYVECSLWWPIKSFWNLLIFYFYQHEILYMMICIYKSVLYNSVRVWSWQIAFFCLIDLNDTYPLIVGMVGFARLCPGDVFEVTLRYGSQKWKSKGRVEKDSSQKWEVPDFVFKALLGDIISIKVKNDSVHLHTMWSFLQYG